MKTSTLLLWATLLFVGTSANAQFFKKIANRAAKAAEETVLQKVDEKTTKETEKTMDTIFEGGKKGQGNKMPKDQKRTSQNKNEPNVQNEPRTVLLAKDFVPGKNVTFSDTFVNDALGDFPMTWNTNASAAVVTFEGDTTRWLQLANSGQFTPDGITDIPENATLEFDLYVGENYNYYSAGLWVNIVAVNDRKKDFTKWSRFSAGQNGVRLWLHPVAASGKIGRTHISNQIDGETIVENGKDFDKFTRSKNIVHVAIWRQKTRIRVYLDDTKIWDIPRAFGEADYNSVVFGTGAGKDDALFYVANLRLAAAGEDKRHALLETGKFETNEILFDTGKASLQESSYVILDELGVLLEKNSGFGLKIIGHTDTDGSTDANVVLSENRAKSVKEYLTDNFAIKGNRLHTGGKGASVPVASNETDAGKLKNRRVEFIKM